MHAHSRVCEPDSSEWLVNPRNKPIINLYDVSNGILTMGRLLITNLVAQLIELLNWPVSPFHLCYVSPEESLIRWRGSSFSLVPHHSLMYFSHSHFSNPSSLPFIPYLSTSLSQTVMMIGILFRWVGSFWNRFLTWWYPFFWIDVTVLKLAPAVDWFSAGDFPQGTTMPSIIRPQHVASFWAGTVFKPLLNLGSSIYWNWGVGPKCHVYTMYVCMYILSCMFLSIFFYLFSS